MRRMLLAVLLLPACADGTGGRDAGVAVDHQPALATTQRPQLPVAKRADRSALQELLARVPKKRPAPTGPDGGTLVGSDTGVAAAASVSASASPPKPRAYMGGIEIQPLLSSPAIERAAREQIYWNLMRKCRGPDGQAPPPDAITLLFTIRGDGSVAPASVGATASDKRYEQTAECVVREFSASPFRGPAATRWVSAPIIVTWPSVD